MQRLTFFVARRDDGTFAMKLHDVPVLSFSADGQSARIEMGHGNLPNVEDLVRWGAPLGLAPQGIVCLHGAAALTPSGVIAIIGVGGAGKSTLARMMRSDGCEAVLDDVLVCDDAGNVDLAAEAVLRAWSVEAAATPEHVSYADLAVRLRAVEHRWHPICVAAVLGDRLIVFGGASAASNFTIDPLSPLEAVVALSQHRFGGHAASAAWPPQLRTLAAIVHRANVVKLRVPEGLDALEASIPSISSALMADDGRYRS